MSQPIDLIVYSVKDLDAAKQFFGTFLDAEPYADSPYYVGYRVDDVEVGLDPNGPDGGPIGYINVKDIKATLEQLKAVGAEVTVEPHDVGGGKLVAQVKEPSGNILGLAQNP